MPDVYFFLNAAPEFWSNVNGVPTWGWADFPPGTGVAIKGVADTTVGPGPYCGWWWQHAGGAYETLWVPGPDPGAFPFCMPDVWPNHTEVIIAACGSPPEDWGEGQYPCDNLVTLPFWNLDYCGGLKRPGSNLPGADCLTGPLVSILCD